MIIDAHLHADTRPVENFMDMKMAGVEAIISCAHDPLEMRKSNVTIEHLNRIVYSEPKRVSKHNIKLFAAVGVHPRAIPEDYENVIAKLPDYMAEDHVIAVGEIGLDEVTDIQKEVFIKQLQYADENNYNVIVHTPRTNKAEVTKSTIEVLDEYIDPRNVQLDHIDYSIVDMAIDKDYTLGITVQPQKMSVEGTVAMLDEYGFDKFVVDTDISSAPSNHMALAQLKHKLIQDGYKKQDINKVLYENVMKFHGDNLKI
ncbi:MAG: TatD family hydrolase [Methanosphaera sp.]|uniref:TatD family hydrolase n=1 Tax=Methanosphaera sp. TaxID=2666342 RepID=UPI0025CC97E8|nr:TatD family hydrolase [Methanosphaera sp.]MCI5867145.1 TatD family hydrolase [Methanosphaera sp.]MDD6534786.1 TatD family hydrolase [Methanosphaera sp.]MDY3955546.1 TatD family hydrolase [Methanosphaera sp.]